MVEWIYDCNKFTRNYIQLKIFINMWNISIVIPVAKIDRKTLTAARFIFKKDSISEWNILLRVSKEYSEKKKEKNGTLSSGKLNTIINNSLRKGR